jgi:serine/threonine protein phosphatase PrpC
VSVAHVGDSRCVLADNGRAVALTRDHKATDPEEAKRVVRVSDCRAFITNVRTDDNVI